MNKKLNEHLKKIEKKFGKGTRVKLDKDYQKNVDVIPTGSLSLDEALGVGGIPRGRVVEVFGQPSSGKTSLLYSTISQGQDKGLVCSFVDAEHSFDAKYAEKMGVNLEDLLLFQPDSGEQALEIVNELALSGEVALVVVDSVSALTPQAEIDNEMQDETMGLQARLLSKAMRKLAGVCHKTNTGVVFINQIRKKIGVMFGSPNTVSGGQALKFYTSVRLSLRRGKKMKQKDEVVGHKVIVDVKKNKVAPPFKKAEFSIFFDEGLSESAELLAKAIELDIVDKAGSWYSYKKDKIGQGFVNAKNYLKDNKKVKEEIKKKILKEVGNKD